MKKKRDCRLVSYNGLDATLTGRINDTLVSNVLCESIEAISSEMFDRLPLKPDK